MKKYEVTSECTMYVGDRVWYKNAEFVVLKLRRNKFGKVVCELDSVSQGSLKQVNTITLVSNVSKERPESKFDKKETNQNEEKA